MKVSTVSKERFLIDRGSDAKRASRTSWGEESYVKIGTGLPGTGRLRCSAASPPSRGPGRGSDRGLDAGSLPNDDAGRPRISTERS